MHLHTSGLWCVHLSYDVWTILDRSGHPNALVSNYDRDSNQEGDRRLLFDFVKCSDCDWGLDLIGYG
jgi:hypothetical protein